MGRQTNKERILRLAFGEFSLPIRLHICLLYTSIIALDCTSQITHEGRPAYELLPILKKEIPEAIIFADVSNYEEAVRAVEMGAYIVGPVSYTHLLERRY